MPRKCGTNLNPQRRLNTGGMWATLSRLFKPAVETEEDARERRANESLDKKHTCFKCQQVKPQWMCELVAVPMLGNRAMRIVCSDCLKSKRAR